MEQLENNVYTKVTGSAIEGIEARRELFVISFLALVAQHVYNFFIQNYIEMTGSQMILPIVTFIIALFLIYFSKQKSQQGVLI